MMEEPERNKDKAESSPSKDDSLKDFKSPKTEAIVRAASKVKILIDKRAKKSSSSKRASSTTRKKEASAVVRTTDGGAQPSIESAFFKAANFANRDGHTCPLCMKYFADPSAGTAHSKSCAARNNVSTRKLLAAVALQERQGDERRAIGLPAGPFVKPKEKTPRRYREPVLNADPSLELALALSKSLQENELEREFEEALVLAAQHRGDEPVLEITESQRRQTLKNFGFSSNKPAALGISDGPIKSRRKKHLGPTILQTRTQESRDRLLSERIAEILMGNEAITQVCRQANSDQVVRTKSVLKSRLLRKIHQTTKRLWDSAELSTDITNFYVEELSPVVMPSANLQQESSIERNESAMRQSRKDSSSRTEENPREFDEKVSMEISDSSENRPNEVTKNPRSEMRDIHVTDRQYRNTVPADWSNILNVSSMSDVVVMVNNNHIWAHKLVFHVRCSDILLECVANDDSKFAHVKEKVPWTDVDFIIALAFLEFVYSGVIEKNSHIFDDNCALSGVRRLARKYRLKDLFDYMRKRKMEIGACRETKARKEESIGPMIVDDAETTSEINKNNVANDEIEEIHVTRDKISEKNIEADVIDENHIEVNEIFENHPQNDKSSENQTENVIKDSSLQFSSRREFVELSIEKSSSHRADTMSPDLFDETIRESERMNKNAKNSDETIEQITEDNSDLRILAQLIANDDSSSEQSSQESAPLRSIENKIPTIFPSTKPINDNTSSSIVVSDKIENKALESIAANKSENSMRPAKIHNCRNFSQSYAETPRLRDNIADTMRYNRLSRSQSFPIKSKSNLSLFIEKVQKINSKPALDSYAEDDSLGGPIDRRRFRNPFNVNNASKRSIENYDREKRSESPENVNEIFSQNNSQLENEDKKKKNNNKKNRKRNNSDASLIDEESTKLNENSSTKLDKYDKFCSTDDTICTDDEDVSMYSKYKKTNKLNNSIVNYRNILEKLYKVSEKMINDENNENEISSNVVAIDLTRESDEEDIVAPADSSSSVNLRNFQKSINQIDDSDSNDSFSLKNNRQVESRRIIENNDKNVSSSPVLERNNPRKRSIDDSSEDLAKNFEDSTKDANNSLELSDLDVFEIDEDILVEKNSNLSTRKTLSPSSNRSFSSSPVPRKSTPAREREGKNDERTNGASIDDSERNEKSDDCLTLGSSQGTKNSRNSLDYPDSDVFEVNDEIFTQSLKNFVKSPIDGSSTRFDSPRRFESSRGERKSDETRSRKLKRLARKDDERQEPRDVSPQRSNSPKSSPEYSLLDFSAPNNEIFTQSSKSLDNSPRKTLNRSPFRRADTTREMISRTSNGRDERTKRKIEDSMEYRTDGFSPEAINSKISPLLPELDFFDRNEEIFTQSLKKPSETRSGASTPSSRRVTLRVASPILISSSPEFSDEFSASKERNFNGHTTIERNKSPVSSRSRSDDHEARFSPLCLEKSPNPRPGTSHPGSSSRRDRDASNSVKKLETRSISMPESTFNGENNRKRTRSPKKSSRLTMSQQLTPPRNYDAMDTPELKRELQKYGIKPQKRKRARQLLNHIYNELHPSVPIACSRKNSANDVVEESDDEEPPLKKFGIINDSASSDSESDRDLSLSQESVTSQTSVIPEEMEFQDADVSPKEIAGPMSIGQAFIALMKSDKKLHTKVLTYEPLPLEILHSTLKARGLKCKQNDLMDFLDEQCITFQVLAQVGKSRTKKASGRKGPKRKDKSKSAGNLDSV